MNRITGIVLFAFVCLCGADPSHPDGEEPKRDGKVLPVFQVVRFPNDLCTGSSRNGTCYTSEECSSKGGTNDGSCASGFGVCCTFSLSCGGSASENQTYLTQTSVTSLTSPCTYTVCPCGTNICRIRFDFETFVLAAQSAGTTVEGAVTISTLNEAIGDCTTDTFSITGGKNAGTPVICGTNTGYHMIVDSGPGETTCHQAQFNIGGSTSTSRSWSIRVTQYACGDYDSSGWPGCLQYYTATANTIQNFGFSPTATTVTSTVTHLSNQKYDICIRRASGYCYICYSPSIVNEPNVATASKQTSFGLSLGGIAATGSAQQGTDCSTDYLDIPYGNTATIAAITTPSTTATSHHKFCGRFLSTITDDLNSLTVCTRRSPFTIGVNLDSNEATGGVVADKMSTVIESGEIPGGIIGFSLTYFQVAC